MSRPSGRNADQTRSIKITRNYTKHAEGSVLVEFGDTKVLCNASVEESVPGFLRGKKSGWITAEYGMLPRSTNSRMNREAARGKQTGRTVEIQRLIGPDGGTRTASITGACVALADALQTLVDTGKLTTSPLKRMVASISVGIYQGEAVLDLDYPEDSAADTDMNIIMADDGGIIEIQGTKRR